MKDIEAKLPKENKIPTVKVARLEDDIDNGSLPARIMNQNSLEGLPEDIVVKKTWPGRRGKTVILALHRNGIKALGGRAALNIGWSRCPVFDIFFWPRCTRCATHGHIAPDCNDPQLHQLRSTGSSAARLRG
ncbi:hypothetical protein MTO96_031823 [Rhipicephalus appendiculatus]